MKIAGYLKTSLIEWPGKITSVIFTPGCNFRCPFCHNRDLVDENRIAKLPEIKEAVFFADLKERKKWIDAVVVTGGEPTLQPDLEKFLEKIKKMGFLTMLETNGAKPEILERLFKKKLLNKISMDIKGPLDKRYAKIANVKSEVADIKKIEDSIGRIIKSGIEYEFRTTVVPKIHDKEMLLDLANRMRKTPGKWFLQKFLPKNCLDPRFEKIKPFSEKEYEEFLILVKKIFPGALLR